MYSIVTMADPTFGRGVQVLIPNEDHTFSLNVAEMEELFLNEAIKDKPAVVITIAGAYRKGKSFILNFFLRFMHQRYNLRNLSTDDWLGKKDEPLKGFSWRGGSERNTTGLLFWSQPFIATLDSGEEVVIFLMDTQGTFDSNSTVKDNATVFAMSTMLSSVQIYNLSSNIEEDDLQHLELFTDYGRLALESSAGKPFQRLQFLVRDWNYPYDHPYGALGGGQLLEKRLGIKEDQHTELQSLRKHIVSCFEEIACFLMPHPGLNVATNPNFKGSLNDISDDFIKNLKEFITMLAEPENLVIKKIGGNKVKARDIILYFKSYLNVFNGSTLPEPKTILQATAEANNLSAVAEAKDVYERLMEEAAGGARSYLSPDALLNEHVRAKDKALLAFSSKKKMGGEGLSATYEDKLIDELIEQYEEYKVRNNNKNVFRRLGTALVLAMGAMVGWALASIADVLGLHTVTVLANVMAISCFILLILWVYSRVSGNLASLAQILDNNTHRVMNVFTNKVVEVNLLKIGLEAIEAKKHQ